MINTFCKKPLWECSQTLAAVAQGREPADTVIKGAKLVNVCTAEIQEGIDVAVVAGRIAYVGQADHCIGKDTQVIDAQGQYIAPGFLDGHIHVESSMMGAGEYARAVVPHGTTGIYWDPHEVCNVLGLEGVKVMVEDAARTPLKAMVTTPSCVPAVPGFEDTGSFVGPEDIAATMEWPSVVGLGEMMNFPGILAGTDHAHGEVAETLKVGKTVTGHYSMPETDQGLNAYVASGVRCCHESTRAEDALAKMRLGMYAQLRYGSAWKDLPVLAEAVLAHDVDTRFAMLVSDDTHPHTLVADGHLDHIVRTAVELGIDPVTAIQMVTINCAQCFQMDHELGSIAPGKCADIVFLDDLEHLQVTRVLIDGEVVAENGRATFHLPPFPFPAWVTHSMHLGREIAPDTFAVPAPVGAADGDTVRVRTIEVIPGKVGTFETHVDLPVADAPPGVRRRTGRPQDVRVRAPPRDREVRLRLRQGLRHQARRDGLHRGARRAQPAGRRHERRRHGAGREHARRVRRRHGGGRRRRGARACGASHCRPHGRAARRGDEREGACPRADLGRDRLHHALPLHDDGPDPAGLPPRAKADEPRVG